LEKYYESSLGKGLKERKNPFSGPRGSKRGKCLKKRRGKVRNKIEAELGAVRLRDREGVKGSPPEKKRGGFQAIFRGQGGGFQREGEEDPLF